MRKDTEIILSSGDKSFKLPINPSNYNFVQEYNNHVFETIHTGEINVKGKAKIRRLSLSSFFPSKKNNYPFVSYNSYPEPFECKAMIDEWAKSEKPIRCLITETDINLTFLIDKFDVQIKDASGDLYYNLELSEYISLNVEPTKNPASTNVYTGLKTRPRVNVSATPSSKARFRNTTEVTLKKGEDLYYKGFKGDYRPTKEEIEDEIRTYVGLGEVFNQVFNQKTKYRYNHLKNQGTNYLQENLTGYGATNPNNNIPTIHYTKNKKTYYSSFEKDYRQASNSLNTYGVQKSNWRKLAKDNNVVNPRKLKEGDKLKMNWSSR